MSYRGPLLSEPRRTSPRVTARALCTEYDDESERHSFVVDMSASGLRIERPYRGGRTPGTLQLEFELPGVDELVWARGEVAFDRVIRVAEPGEVPRLVRRLGLRLSGAMRDLALLREYVFWRRARRPPPIPVVGAADIAAFTL
jgi:hypothetical protein